MLESALYYTYFRSHPSELATLVRKETKYYLDREYLLEYHKLHSPEFTERQSVLGFAAKLGPWFSELSGVIHGQQPGSWGFSEALAGNAYSPTVCKLAVDKFERGVELISDLFLSTVSYDHWSGFNKDVKKELLKGLSAHVKSTLGLTIA